MRDIKFRGKRPDNGQWAYGDLIASDCMATNIMNERGDRVSVNAATVGQYTGLKDRDGKDIYEGDIVAIPDCDKPQTVTYGNAAFYLSPSILLLYGYYDADGNPDGIRVTGNLHDAPELLK